MHSGGPSFLLLSWGGQGGLGERDFLFSFCCFQCDPNVFSSISEAVL